MTCGDFFDYETPKQVHVKSKFVGVLNRLIEFLIIAYICGWVTWLASHLVIQLIERYLLIISITYRWLHSVTTDLSALQTNKSAPRSDITMLKLYLNAMGQNIMSEIWRSFCASSYHYFIEILFVKMNKNLFIIIYSCNNNKTKQELDSVRVLVLPSCTSEAIKTLTMLSAGWQLKSKALSIPTSPALTIRSLTSASMTSLTTSTRLRYRQLLIL